ncbi:hypothetical protein Mal4_30620 [Maioricimonas rarisocia]|uniref:Uncharacterized protein n=1 Tax=Maioricimonas rarisocia TaxID=2528026 RepID=A0A517Z8B5_9PLAN|nr:hypothetical protein [Maioricimonas rarisocia]QDU38732.1 hypothetical protein Mal4_30620 [Maioricimonas rarisocia]
MIESRPLPDLVRAAIDCHLSLIDHVLRDAGAEEGERRTICDEVESMIQERLARVDSGPLTLAGLEAVLAEMDPPEAFADDATGDRPGSIDARAMPPAEPSLHRFVIPSISISIGSLALAFLMIVILKGNSGILAAGVVVASGWLLATLLACDSMRSIRESPRRFRGFGLAYVAVALPLLLAAVIATGAGVEAVADTVRNSRSDKVRQMDLNKTARALSDQSVSAPGTTELTWAEANEPLFVSILWLIIFPTVCLFLAFSTYGLYLWLRPHENISSLSQEVEGELQRVRRI